MNKGLRKQITVKKPIIIDYDCIEHDPIDTWLPNDIYDVDVWINFTIGTDKSAGDNFLVRVVTPNNVHGKNDAKHAIILNEYSWKNVLLNMETILEKSQGYDWLDISEKLSQFMQWEYQDYKP